MPAMKPIRIGLFCTALIYCSSIAAADNGWLESGKNLLNGLLGYLFAVIFLQVDLGTVPG